MAEPLPPPVPISLILCDHIHTDPYTRRKTLLGLFDEFFAGEFPTAIPVLYCYTEVTGCRGTSSLRLSVVLADPEAEPVWESDPVEIASDSPLTRHFLEWGVANLPIPEPGVYLVQLVDGYDRVIHDRTLYAELFHSTPPEAAHDE